MHKLQHAILELASKVNLGEMTLRAIGEHVGETHPQKIKHHIGQLKLKGFLRSGQRLHSKNLHLISIPIVGSANCGEANCYAVENVEGYLKVSPSMVPKKKGLFAIRAVGSSMNRASVGGRTIDDGDYIIIDPNSKNPQSGDYVLSIIDGAANIKKFRRDHESNQIVLISESTQELPPIYIHPKDYAEYMLNGKAVQVIKKLKAV